MARAGSTVLAPSPVYPDRSPFTSSVGRAQIRSSAPKPFSPARAGAPTSRRSSSSSKGSPPIISRSSGDISRTSS
jgi:hypothetical protein